MYIYRPRHTKTAIPYSLAPRLRRICSNDHYFENRVKDLHNILLERGYKNGLVKESITRARVITREDKRHFLQSTITKTVTEYP